MNSHPPKTIFAAALRIHSLLLIKAIVFIALVNLNVGASAQGWKVGQGKLMGGDYKGAEAALTQALGVSRSAADRAEILKFLGVAQYMQSKSQLAAKSFALAVKLNPSVKLTENEVADESVLPFFMKQRGAPGKAGPSLEARTANPKVPPTRTPTAKPAFAKSKKTLVKVECNVSNAQVSMDGIAYGTVGTDLEVSPGTVVLEISAQGYITKAIKIQIEPKTANTVKVELQKPAPKPKPVAKVLPLPSTKGAGGGRVNAGAKPAKGDLFAGDQGSIDEFSNPSMQRGPGGPSLLQQAQGTAPPAAPQNPMLPQGAYAQPMQPNYPPQQGPAGPYGYPQLHQPAFQQPMYQQPPYQQPPYQQPMYPQSPYQQPMYPQSPYQQPYQQPPQSVYSPYSGGYPAATPPPYDPYTAGGYTPPPPELPPPALTPVPPQVDPLPAAPAEPKESGKPPPMKPPKDIFASKSKKSAKTSPGGGCSFFIKILPLGAGQFCQGSVFKGVLFAGAQVGGLYFYKQNSDAATKFTGQVANLKSQREAGRENYSGDEQIAYDAETDQKVKEGNAAASKASNNATMSLAVFGGAWAIGIIDAVAFGPGKSKRTVKKARLSLLLPTRGDPETTFALVSYLPSYKPDTSSWYMGYSIDHQHPERNLGSLKLGVSWEL